MLFLCHKSKTMQPSLPVAGVTFSPTPARLTSSHGIKHEHLPVMTPASLREGFTASAPSPPLSHFSLNTAKFRGRGGRTGERKGHLMHSKQLKHFKPLNPDRRRERKGKSDRERCDERVGGGQRRSQGRVFFPVGDDKCHMSWAQRLC